MKKNRQLYSLLAIAMTLPVIGMALSLSAQKSHDAALARNFNTFNSIVKQVEMHYVDSINTNEGFNAAIAAYLMQTDPYTEYYDAENQEKVQLMTTGEYGGIGSFITERNGATYISQPMAGSPALKAGLRAGDHIIMVDDVDVSAQPSENVTKLLKGIPGTSVRVTVDRPYVQDSILAFDITRAKVRESSVMFDTVINGNGYIRLRSFIDKTPEEVREVFNRFKDQDLKGMVIDLRGNGGGIVESAIDLVSYFVPKGTEVAHTLGRDPAMQKVYKTTRKPMFPDLPLVVLIDGGTASSSEIFAGALQDLDRAVLAGSRSYGKGLVQATLDLPYGDVLKVTIAKYYLPSGRLIQAVDYSNRNPDGSVARVPDSLTNVYKTLHGREVRDGGGLRPDTTIDWGSVNRLVYNAVADQWIFDYVTKFVAENPSIAAPSEFEVTDSIFSGFKAFIDPAKFKYDKVCEEMLKQLEKAAETEGYMNDETKAQFEILSKLLTHNLDHDLDNNRKVLSDYIGEELAERYYQERGKVAYEIRHDKGLDAALEILKDTDKFLKK